MISDVQPMTKKQKLNAVKKVQFQLESGQSKHPLVRACGLTELELRVLTNEWLIEVFDDADTDVFQSVLAFAVLFTTQLANQTIPR